MLSLQGKFHGYKGVDKKKNKTYQRVLILRIIQRDCEWEQDTMTEGEKSMASEQQS